MKLIRQLFARGSSQPGAANAGKSQPAPLLPTLGVSNSLFADASNFEQRFVEDYEKISLPGSA
jgi:hypothetical protein